jgi:hypothetical protein
MGKCVHRQIGRRRLGGIMRGMTFNREKAGHHRPFAFFALLEEQNHCNKTKHYRHCNSKRKQEQSWLLVPVDSCAAPCHFPGSEALEQIPDDVSDKGNHRRLKKQHIHHALPGFLASRGASAPNRNTTP